MRRNYELSHIANLDQAGLSFIIHNRKTYDTTNSKYVWRKLNQSGLDMWQCTLQPTVFADGIPHVRALIIFLGQWLHIENSKKEQWDKRVTVQFQNDACCDQRFIVTWIQNDWCGYFRNPPMPGSNGKLLIADIHQFQETNKVKNYLRRCKTQFVDIHGGLTGYFQVLFVFVDKTFKAYV